MAAVVAGILGASTVSRAAHAERVHLELVDGSVLDGELIDLTVGVRARVQMDDGTIRAVNIAELRVVPEQLNQPLDVSVSLRGAPTREDEARNWTRPREGSVPVLLESTGDAQVLTTESHAPLCSTPCLLYLTPGLARFNTGGAGLLTTNVALRVDDVPLRVQLHMTPNRGPTWIWGLFSGFAFSIGGVGIAFAATVPQTSPGRSFVEHPLGWTGLGLSIVGIAGGISGLIMAIPVARGVAHIEPFWTTTGAGGLTLSSRF